MHYRELSDKLRLLKTEVQCAIRAALQARNGEVLASGSVSYVIDPVGWDDAARITIVRVRSECDDIEVFGTSCRGCDVEPVKFEDLTVDDLLMVLDFVEATPAA